MTSDGVIGTNVLKQFLSTVDYANQRLTFRERSETSRQNLFASYTDAKVVEMPFVLVDTHLQFAKGSLDGHAGLDFLVDSGLAASMPLIVMNETVEELGVKKNPIPNGSYYWVPIKSHGLGPLLRGETQALGNVIVEEEPYWHLGFIWDALISHQYLKNFPSWTIDFDTMTYYFPSK